MEGDLVTVEAHPVGTCDVMTFVGAVECWASNGGLLVPGACASCVLIGWVPGFGLGKANPIHTVQGSFPSA